MSSSLLALTLTLSGAVGGDLHQVDADRSDIHVRLYRAGPASGFAHNHIVDAPEMEGFAVVDPDNQAIDDVHVTVDATALIADPPALRQAYSLDKPMSDEDRREIQSTMLGEGQLAVERYPDITFAADHFERTNDGRYLARGELTLHGVSRRMAVPLQVDWAGDVVRVQGRFDIKQSQFGIEPYSAVFGAIRNEDRVTIYVDLVLRASKAGMPAKPKEPGEPT